MNKNLGYYSVGKTIFFSKVEACVFATNLYKRLKSIYNIDPKSLVRWHFNNDIFEKYDWKVESDKTLDNLYDERAKKLRHKYDYIMICYSGGADSHNMLMSFLRQGLFVDEIVVTHMHDIAKNYTIVDTNNLESQHFYEAEYQLQILPRLREISAMSPKTRITVLDTSNSIKDFFSLAKDESWIFKVREELNPVDASRFDLLKFAKIERNLDNNKKIAVILGIDKIKLSIDKNTNECKIYFTDRITNQIPISEHIKDYTNTYIEFFYWSADACELLCKQGHVVKKWLENNPFMQQFFYDKPNLLKDNRYITDRVLRSVLYTTWIKEWFQSEKCQLDWHAEYDTWFFNHFKNTTEYSLWSTGINYVTNSCAPYVQYHLDNKNKPDGFIRWKNYYSIGFLYNRPLEPKNVLEEPKILEISERDIETMLSV